MDVPVIIVPAMFPSLSIVATVASALSITFILRAPAASVNLRTISFPLWAYNPKSMFVPGVIGITTSPLPKAVNVASNALNSAHVYFASWTGFLQNFLLPEHQPS